MVLIVPKHVPTYSSSQMDSEIILSPRPISNGCLEFLTKGKGQGLISIGQKLRIPSDLVSNYLLRNNKMPKTEYFVTTPMFNYHITRQNTLNCQCHWDSMDTYTVLLSYHDNKISDIVKTSFFETLSQDIL